MVLFYFMRSCSTSLGLCSIICGTVTTDPLSAHLFHFLWSCSTFFGLSSTFCGTVPQNVELFYFLLVFLDILIIHCEFLSAVLWSGNWCFTHCSYTWLHLIVTVRRIIWQRHNIARTRRCVKHLVLKQKRTVRSRRIAQKVLMRKELIKKMGEPHNV